MFALRHKETKELAGFSASENGDGDLCCSISYELENKYSDNVWVVKDRDTAERAANESSEWYNANYDTPTNDYLGEWEVVELGVLINV